MGASQSTQSLQKSHKVTESHSYTTVASVVLEKQASAIANASPSCQLTLAGDKTGDSNKARGSATVTLDDIETWKEAFDGAPANRALSTLLSKQDILDSLTTREAEINDIQVFNTKLSTQVTPITNQKQSGRCWLFAALNMARITFAKKYNVDEFQFSQAYPFLYDHLEKANVYLENIIDLAGEELTSRVMEYLLSSPVTDGGEWAFAVNLFERYGLIPQSLYPESFSSSSSAKMDILVDSKLREYCLELRKLFKQTMATVLAQTNISAEQARQAAVEACRLRKREQMGEIYSILALCLGAPPSPTKKFVYEFYDKDKNYRKIEMTPLELYRALEPDFRPKESFSIMHEPNHELGYLYTLDRMQNVHGGIQCLFVNTDITDLEDAVIKMIKADMPVWFACDARAAGDRKKGLWDVNVRDYEAVFGTKLGMNKAERLNSGDSYPTHAMMISGVHVENGRPVRYRIENSWGPDYGDKGFFVATAEWFREFSYEVIVPKKIAPPKLVKVLEAGNPKILPPWATMRKRPSKGMAMV